MNRPPALSNPTPTANAKTVTTTLDPAALAQLLDAAGEPGLAAAIAAQQPHLFSPHTLQVAHTDIEQMRAVIGAIESVVATPGYQETVLAWAPPMAQYDPGPRGVFLGYDFHLSPAGPQLIEINTNAGGALLAAAAARACRAPNGTPVRVSETLTRLDDDIVEMFRAEWRRQRGDAPLNTIAIVDDQPAQQYLYPEFRLFAALFRRHGMTALIVDPDELMLCHGGVWVEETRIDLVYNRLTDFSLANVPHTTLREAYVSGAAVVTPHPRAHAVYADKRNLTLLSDEGFLRGLGLPDEVTTTVLRGVPRTVAVTPEAGERFWSERKQWFFKPVAGYGARGAYRGDKLTRQVFARILNGEDGAYIAQVKVDPPVLRTTGDSSELTLKYDLRNFVYAGAVQLVAARLYQGQTTNFRTPGGGFATVLSSP